MNYEDLPKIAPLNNLYIESSRMISGFTGLLERIVDAITPQRLLFGSGSPFKEILPAILKIEQSKLTTLDKNNIPVWIRQVLIPGYTDDEQDLLKLKEFIDTLKKQVVKKTNKE